MIARHERPAVIVVMGVASSGKTSLGERLADHLGWPFRDADSFHPPENVAKMAGGTALNDEDRKPWLAAIAGWIDALRAGGAHGIVTCSALKRAYRRVIVGDRADVALVYLKGSRALIGARMAKRKHHFMPEALLDSQFAALEEPGEGERVLIVPVDLPKDAILARVLAELGLAATARPGGRRPPHPVGEGWGEGPALSLRRRADPSSCPSPSGRRDPRMACKAAVCFNRLKTDFRRRIAWGSGSAAPRTSE